MGTWLRLHGSGSWSRLSCSNRQAWAKPSLKFQRVPSPGGAESVPLVVSGDPWENAAVRTKEGVKETLWRRQAPRPPCGTLAVSCPRQGPCRPAPPGKQHVCSRSQEDSGDTYGKAARRESDSQSQWLPCVMQKHLG